MSRLPLFIAGAVLIATPLSGQEKRPAATDTVDAASYEGWKQYSLICARCHGEDAQGTSFGPSLLAALKAGQPLASPEAFRALLITGRPDKGMGSASTLGLAPEHIDGLYGYLSGRSAGKLKGGRPVSGER